MNLRIKELNTEPVFINRPLRFVDSAESAIQPSNGEYGGLGTQFGEALYYKMFEEMCNIKAALEENNKLMRTLINKIEESLLNMTIESPKHISLSEAKKRIEDLLASEKNGLEIDEVIVRTGLEIQVVIDACEQLRKEGLIE